MFSDSRIFFHNFLAYLLIRNRIKFFKKFFRFFIHILDNLQILFSFYLIKSH